MNVANVTATAAPKMVEDGVRQRQPRAIEQKEGYVRITATRTCYENIETKHYEHKVPAIAKQINIWRNECVQHGSVGARAIAFMCFKQK